jgi:glycosyltransferase involved in cell wall biosynthesis
MKILIEGSSLFGVRTGVGQYSLRLFDALFELDKRDDFIIYSHLFFGKSPQNDPRLKRGNVRYCFVRVVPGKIANQFRKKIFTPPADILTFTHPNAAIYPNFVHYPLWLGGKTIVFIYDLSFLKFPQFSDLKNLKDKRRFTPKAAQRATAIVTISENSKREIMEEYGVSEDRITIINPALDHQEYRPRSEAEVAAVRQKFTLDKPYILYTGTLEPRKNIVGILEAYAALPEKLRGNYSLVLAGGKGWQDEEIKAKLNELSNLDIRQTGYVADEDLPPLYTGASVFVYPSHYEGFGMPPLEAMACGTPVITSNNSSLPEVVREAGIMIETTDTKALTANIQKVLTDQAFADNLRKKGFEQAAKFTWEESAKRLKALIEKVGAK